MAREPTLETFWAHPQPFLLPVTVLMPLSSGLWELSEDRQEQVCGVHVCVCDGRGSRVACDVRVCVCDGRGSRVAFTWF